MDGVERLKCPSCGLYSKPVPVDMGDRTVKCRICGRYIRYKFRSKEVMEARRPERVSSSGLMFYR